MSLLLLKDLNSLQEKADAEGFGFLSYLLRMAVLETQAIATQSLDEPVKPTREVDGLSYEVSSPSAFDGSSYEYNC